MKFNSTKWVFTVVGGLLFQLQSSGTNLITNPSFENACSAVCNQSVGGNVYNGCISGWQTSHSTPGVYRNDCPLITGEQASDGNHYLFMNAGGVFTEVNMKKCFPYTFKMDYQQAINATGACSPSKIFVAGANALFNNFNSPTPSIPHEIITEVFIPNSPSNTWQSIVVDFETSADWKYLWIYADFGNGFSCTTLGAVDNLSLEEGCESPLGCSADFTHEKTGKFSYQFNSNVNGFSSLAWTFTNTVTGNVVISTETNQGVSTIPCSINDPNCGLFLPSGTYEVCIEAQFTNVFTGEDCFAKYCEEIELIGLVSDPNDNSKRSTSKTSLNKPLQVFPNPANDHLKIRGLEDSSPLQEYSLWNLNGQLVQSGNLRGNSDVNISSVPNGTYLLKISSADQEFQQKVTILH